MKNICCAILVLLVLAGFNAKAQTSVADASSLAVALPAKTVLQNALVEAIKENKKVLLIFHASWCGWCHKMDASLNDPTCKKFFDDNFITTHITVMESKGKENLENAGGKEIMEKYNGKQQGLPYWVILDKNAKLLFDSQIRTTIADGTIKGQNIGCPASKDEVANFIALLRQTTNLTAPELEIITTRFRQNEN